MPEFMFSSSFGFLLLLAGALAAFGLARFSYRTTVPPVSPAIRYVLLVLRAAGLFFLLFFIGEPLLSILQTEHRPPVTAVLVDVSRSMTISDPSGTRSQRVLDILQTDAIRNLESIGSTRYIAFSDEPRELEENASDSILFKGDQTNITDALRFIRQQALTENIQSIVLISDGNNTQSPSPIFDVEALTLPVFAIGIGDTSDQKDVLVRKVTTNSLVYSGNRVPVHIQVRSSGAQDERVEVTLRHSSGVLDRQLLSLEPGIREYPVTLSYVPAGKGIQRYTVEVTGIPGELTGRNNRTGFFVKVLESKMNVVLLAGGPSPDVAFIRRILEADSNITVSPYVEQGGGSYYQSTPGAGSFADQDCMLLVGFPSPSTPRPVIDLVLQAAERGAGILYIPSRTIDFGRLATIASVLPVNIGNPTHEEQAVFPHLPASSATSPLLNLPTGFPSDVWSRLPPLYTFPAEIRAKPESKVHAGTRIRTVITGKPLLVSRNVNRKKSIALVGYGFWRWTMLAEPSSTGILDALISNCVRWLTTREEDSKIRITASKETYTVGEPVEFSGQVYDETFRPVEDARVSLILSGAEQAFNLSMRDLGNGHYDGQVHGVGEGDYTFAATVQKGGQTLGRVIGSLSIGESNAEFLETRANYLLLRQLAARSGGRFYPSEDIQDLGHDVGLLPDRRSKEVVHSEEFALWNLHWSLAFVILLFSLEWIIRKTRGML